MVLPVTLMHSRVTKIWVIVGLLFIFPPIIALLDSQMDYASEQLQDVSLQRMLLVQGILGAYTLAGSVAAMLTRRIGLLLVAAPVLAAAYAAWAFSEMLADPPEGTGVLGIVIVIVFYTATVAMAFFTWREWFRQRRSEPCSGG